WVASCDKSGITITAKEAQDAVDTYRGQRNSAQSRDSAEQSLPRPPFTNEAFVDALVEFIVADDQSLNIIESKQLRAIFLLLREQLKDSDIPHRTTLRNRIKELFEEHLVTLKDTIAAFMFIIDRLDIAHKIGWITMDNAPNNDTCIRAIARELRA
ncbi:hypothetical protein FA95DRAFT_1465474, partial [Auriscalpium vulgare]